MIKLKKQMTASEIAKAVGGTLYGNENAVTASVAIDSRDVESGAMFAAIPGERTDGHNYIAAAAEKGASLILGEKDRLCALSQGGQQADFDTKKTAVIAVPDTVAALGALGHYYLSLYSPRIVAITGSVGKTTTKEYIFAALSGYFRTHKTDGNYNSVIGLPLTVMNMAPTDEMLVLEMGMSGYGEIAAMTETAPPDIGVVTNIGTSHIGLLGSREGIRDAKMELAAGLKPDGVMVLNGDEPLLDGYGGIRVAMENGAADVLVENIRQNTEESKTTFDLRIKATHPRLQQRYGDTVHICAITIHDIGAHVVFDAAIAFVVGVLCGVPEMSIREGLTKVYKNPMRQNVVKREVSGIGAVTFIEDCYNASPESMRTALSVLDTVAAGRRIAVLGDMRELGDYAEALHKALGETVAKKADLLFTLGEDAALIAAGAKDAGMPADRITAFPLTDTDPHAALAAALKSTLRPGDTVLLKASRSVKMEQVAAKLLG